MDEYLYLWPIYGSALVKVEPDPNERLTECLKIGGNVAVLGGSFFDAKRALVTSLRNCAKESHDRLVGGTVLQPTDGWLVVDVPIPARVEPYQLLHRMIRRLYFSAVLHGMGEVESFRETVQVLRLAFLQTRGKVSQGRDAESVDKSGFELGGNLKLSPEVSAKLTAGDEVKIVEKLNAEMARLDLLEAEDELTYDLTILQRLEIFADQHAQALGEPGILPRWEKIRGWFKKVYSPLSLKGGIRLRAAYVFEARSVVTVLGLARFLAQAAGLASAHAAQILLLGGPELAAAIQADRELGRPVFRGSFAVQQVGAVADKISAQQKALLASVAAGPPEDWAPEIVAIAKRMDGILDEQA